MYQNERLAESMSRTYERKIYAINNIIIYF